jgi:DNA-binding CsgD family transcriptional regulator
MQGNIPFSARQFAVLLRFAAPDVCPLTDADILLLQCWADGKPRDYVCRALGCAPRQLRRRADAVRAKLKAKTRTHAVVIAWMKGWVA